MTAPDPAGPAAPSDPFGLAGFQAQPRVAGLAVSPDGTRAVVRVNALNRDANRFVGALWSVDPAGVAPARRLTRSTPGEAAPRFLPSGDLLFVSARPAPDPAGSPTSGDDPTALWLLPAAGGDARPVAVRPGGIDGVVVATDAGTVVVVAPTLPSSTDDASEAAGVEARRAGRVHAILHDSYPVRYWDHDLGAAAPRLFVATPDPVDPGAPGPGDPDAPWGLRDLTGHVGHALDEADVVLTPDGSTVVSTWQVGESHGSHRVAVVAIDVATGARRLLADSPDHEFGTPRVSPDGRQVALTREHRSTPTRATAVDVVVVPLAGGPVRAVTAGWNGWPHDLRWTPDSAALVVGADFHGRWPLFRVDVGAGVAPTDPLRLTPDDGAYGEFEVLPSGDVVAVRNAVDAAPAPVRVAAAGGAGVPLPGPVATPVAVPGRLEEVSATAADGTAVRAWLALPTGASSNDPAPLVLWVHGGPLGSWNGWSWRWNPWLLTARGYAVLLPDPALSTGYGQPMIDRGWGSWGDAPYTDLLAVTDAAEAHPAVDATRTAAMGGSFGGYMANWIAGHTDRFAAIVTHASLWNLETFGATTDTAWFWSRELTAQAAAANSPHRFADVITTPVLVVHGDKDYRVPIGEGLALWWALTSGSTVPPDGDDPGHPHRFLYFPDENHWVLTPGHAQVWYETVLAFLDQHVLGRPWVRPSRLG